MQKLMLRLHRWVGRVVLIYFGFVFLTGTFLVFAPELEAVIAPQMRAAGTRAPASFGQLFDSAVSEFPKARPVTVKRPGSDVLAAQVIMRKKGRAFVVWLDLATAGVQGTSSDLGLYGVVRRLHKNLMIDNNYGKILVTIFSLPLLWQLVSGLMAYRRFWRGWFRWPNRAQPGRAWWGTFHRLAALWVLPILTVSALTGFLFFAGAFGLSSGIPKPQAAVERGAIIPNDLNGTKLDALITVAQEQLPDLEISEVQLPANNVSGITITGQMTARLVRDEANFVTIDPSNSNILGVHRGEDMTVSSRIIEMAKPLHFGVWAGSFSRVLLLIGGALAVLLVISALKIVAWSAAGTTSDRIRGGFLTGWRALWWPIRLMSSATILAGLALAAKALI